MELILFANSIDKFDDLVIDMVKPCILYKGAESASFFLDYVQGYLHN